MYFCQQITGTNENQTNCVIWNACFIHFICVFLCQRCKPLWTLKLFIALHMTKLTKAAAHLALHSSLFLNVLGRHMNYWRVKGLMLKMYRREGECVWQGNTASP
jgi:hypothetical protein